MCSSASSFPPIGQLLPQSKSALLLDEVVESGNSTRVRIGPDFPYLEAGQVALCVSVELVAQTVAVAASLKARAAAPGQAPTPTRGFIVGISQADFHGEAFALGDELIVSAEAIEEHPPLLVYRGEVRRKGPEGAAKLKAAVTLSVFEEAPQVAT